MGFSPCWGGILEVGVYGAEKQTNGALRMCGLFKNVTIVALLAIIFSSTGSARDLFVDPNPLDSPEWRELGKNGFLGPNSIYDNDERVGAFAIFTKREGGTDFKPTVWVLKSVLNSAKETVNKPIIHIAGKGYFSTMSLYQVDCLNHTIKEQASYAYTGTYATGSYVYGLISNGEDIHVPPTTFQYNFFKPEPAGFCKDLKLLK